MKKLEISQLQIDNKKIPIKLHKVPNKTNITYKITLEEICIEYGNRTHIDDLNYILKIETPKMIKAYKKLAKNLEDVTFINTSDITQDKIIFMSQKVEKYINDYSKKMGVSPKKIYIKYLKSSWGICHSNGNISLNAKLAILDDKYLQYVIVHELSHLKYMNHSKEFWDYVGKYYPQYKEVKKELRKYI